MRESTLEIEIGIGKKQGKKVRLTYWESGLEHWQAIVYFHGIPGSHLDLSPLIRQRINQNFRLIILDRAGYGENKNIDLGSSLSEQSHFYIRWLHQIGCKNPILMGHSFSGGLIFQMAKEPSLSPRALVAICPWSFLRTEDRDSKNILKILNLPIFGGFFSFLIRMIAKKSFIKALKNTFGPLEIPADYLRESLRSTANSKTLRAVLQDRTALIDALPELQKTYSQIRIPVLICAGELDQVTDIMSQACRLKDEISGAEIFVDPQMGHSLPISSANWPELFMNSLLKVLNEKNLHKKERVKMSTNSDTRIGFAEGMSSHNNVINYLKRHSTRSPHHEALVWTSKQKLSEWSGNALDLLSHQSINYKDFIEKTNRLAMGLRKLGINKKDPVIIFLPMSVELYQSMFAVLQLGAIAVFLDSWARRTHLGASADTVSPKAMISFEGAFQFCQEVPEIDKIPLKICAFPTKKTFSAHINELEKSEPLTELEAVEQEDSALITFTTGSSGRPKGANRTHQFLSAQHLALDLTIPYTEEDADLPAFPIFSLNNLAAGVTTVIPAVDIGSPNDKDPAILTAQLKSCGATCCTLSPSMLVAVARFCDREKIQLDQLRRVVTGGAPISNDDLKAFKKIAPQTEIWVLYGSTEVEPIAHIEAKEALAAEDDPINGVNVGHFAEGLEYKFIRIHRDPIDMKGKAWKEFEVATGEVGEIVVSGLHVCKSYFNFPEATRATKIFDDQGRVWHRTGDLGYLDSRGRVWLVGRVHNAIERAGKWLYPVKAEILLKRIPQAKNVAFLGVPDSEMHELTCAVISAPQIKDLKEIEKISEEIRTQLEAHDIPVDYALVVDEIPMDPRHHSKVEYSVLLEKLLSSGLIAHSSKKRKLGS